jgi:membrane dipeptidase
VDSPSGSFQHEALDWYFTRQGNESALNDQAPYALVQGPRCIKSWICPTFLRSERQITIRVRGIIVKRIFISGLLAASLSFSTGCSEESNTPSSAGSAKTEAASAESAESIHEQALVLDAHADIEIPGKESRYVGRDGQSQVAPTKMRAGGVDAVVMAIAVGPGPRNEAGYAEARAKADEELAAILAMTADPNDDLVLVRSADELLEAHAEGKRALILGFQNARILGRDPSGLDEFHAAGVRVFALTHMGHNDFSDSSRPLYIAELGSHESVEEHGGLSELGVQAIHRINALGGLVDVSQLSKAATMQVLAISTAPVIASHSNVRRLTNVSRNLSDEEIDGIGENGGVIHVAPFKAYLFDSTDEALIQKIRAARKTAGIPEDYYYPFELYWEIEDPAVQRVFLESVSGLLDSIGVEDVIDHIDYVVQRIGIDHVGIGTDFNHGSGIEGFEDASAALNVTKALLARGYSRQDIEKVWGGNFSRVFRAAQALAE